jgi:hypothetical protein
LKFNIWKITSLAVILLFVVMVSACRPEPVAPEEGQLLILSPSAESTLNSNTVTVSVYVDNFRLVDGTGRDNHSREGHLIYYKDTVPPLVKGKTSLTQQGSYTSSKEKSFTWNNVEPGPHNFWVQLVNNDNTPLEPPVAVRVPITVVLK